MSQLSMPACLYTFLRLHVAVNVVTALTWHILCWADGEPMRGAARPAGPRKYQKEKDLRGLALAKQNARFRRKQSRQSPPPDDRATAAAPAQGTCNPHQPMHALLELYLPADAHSS